MIAWITYIANRLGTSVIVENTMKNSHIKKSSRLNLERWPNRLNIALLHRYVKINTKEMTLKTVIWDLVSSKFCNFGLIRIEKKKQYRITAKETASKKYWIEAYSPITK